MRKIATISVLIVIAIIAILGFRQFSAQTVPSISCPKKELSEPDSLKELIEKSPSIVKGDLVLPRDFPEVMLEPTPVDKVVIKVDERLKGSWPDVGKEIALCPGSAFVLHSQSPILVFLAGKNELTSYWVPLQAYGTSSRDFSGKLYDINFSESKKTYTLDEIRDVIRGKE